MTAEQFKAFWESAYPNTVPISHFFKWDYSDRWFRIHSLPESKRYAETQQEWDILLSRQNSIIADLLGNNAQVYIITGDYDYENNSDVSDLLNSDQLPEGLTFTSLNAIDMNKLNAEEYDKGTIYRPIIAEEIWKPNKFDELLQDIANDNFRAFFLSTKQACLIAPYDGGIDIILKDSATKESFKTKYNNWLSSREDGL
jgi:hypothetical protein